MLDIFFHFLCMKITSGMKVLPLHTASYFHACGYSILSHILVTYMNSYVCSLLIGDPLVEATETASSTSNIARATTGTTSTTSTGNITRFPTGTTSTTACMISTETWVFLISKGVVIFFLVVHDSTPYGWNTSRPESRTCIFCPFLKQFATIFSQKVLKSIYLPHKIEITSFHSVSHSWILVL